MLLDSALASDENVSGYKSIIYYVFMSQGHIKSAQRRCTVFAKAKRERCIQQAERVGEKKIDPMKCYVHAFFQFIDMLELQLRILCCFRIFISTRDAFL